MKFLHRLLSIVLFFTLSVSAASAQRTTFQSNWNEMHDRVWIGAEFWANPMENWRIHNGRLESTSGGADRNVHLLTRQLGEQEGEFEISVTTGILTTTKKPGAVGFHVGIQDEVDDYRARLLRGSGIRAGITTKGVLYLGNQMGKLEQKWESIRLTLKGKKTGELKLSAVNAKSGASLGELSITVSTEKLVGNLALEQNPTAIVKANGNGRPGNGPQFWFQDWKVSGSKLTANDDQKFGPILWAMHTLNHTRQGYVLRMTAQMPPVGKDDSQTVLLEIEENEDWTTLKEETIHPLARTVTFHVENWNAKRKVPYRLTYKTKTPEGKILTDRYHGTIRKDPVTRDLVLAGFTGNTDSGFPNLEICRNVENQNPDILFFSGDQIYESVGGYGIIRSPVEPAVINYLRKWYLFGWAFRDVMRDRVTICLPDDHDVYQGNIWGNGGNSVPNIQKHDEGGYAQHRDFVNVVHRTQTHHHPIPDDPTPIKQNISVLYSHLLYGRVSFAIIADRMFKSGPKQVATWKGRPDHVKDPTFDTTKLDQPGLKLLGDRQLKFLESWVENWWNADQKCLLSQTIFCNLANYHGGSQEFIFADLDSNGWPQTGRNKAVKILRKGFALHVAGDQHLASIVHHGVDEFRDSGFSFCVPSIAAGYPRSWRADAEGRPVRNRPAPGLANTGDYLDAFKNHMTVYAIANPEKKNRPGRINTLHDKASGYGVVRFHTQTGKATMECWRLQVDVQNPVENAQFLGWPHTISMEQNYGRKPVAELPIIRVKGMPNAWVKITKQETGEHIYSLRVRGTEFQPHVFEAGKYEITVGSAEDPEKRQLFQNVVSKPKTQSVLEITFSP